MESTEREVPNSHVPLAFLLGRRASDYRLPTLDGHRQKPKRELALFQDNHPAHARRREAEARELLDRVLALESRVETNDSETPAVRVSTADQWRRAVALERVLREQAAIAATTETAETSPVSPKRRDSASELYNQRERFVSTHGYVLQDPDFVEVIGNPARIQRAQSLRQLYDDEKRQRTKQFKAKQARIPSLKAELHVQQTETKAKLKYVDKTRLRTEVDGFTKPPEAIELKQAVVKQWQDEQQRLLELTKQEETRALERRREAAQRVRQETVASAVRARHAGLDKAKRPSVGPSYQSTLRVEEEVTTANDGVLPLDVLLPPVAGEERFEATDDLGDRLHARQYKLFQKSRARSLHFGGGFASKPRDVSPSDCQKNDHNLTANAKAIALW